MNTNVKEIYSEVYSILNILGNDYISKLPKKLYEVIKNEKSTTYVQSYEENTTTINQNIKKESLAMIALFHLNYWCDSVEEKEQLRQLFHKNENKHQKELREKYAIDFEKRNIKIKENNYNNCNDNTETALIELKKESLFIKVINKIRKLLHIGR